MSDEVQFKVRRTSLWAIAALVCGVIGLVTGVVSIPAVVFGHIARSELSKNPGLSGSGMATAGLILGYIGIAFMVIGLLFFGGLGMIVRLLAYSAM